jgi:tRNA-splicing ligase RtcB (3'-phosphate/5'-hydroxy nucleic acid ligase)
MTLDDTLRPEPLAYPIWGEAYIDEKSREQMNAAMLLPVSVAGALMPDAHVGYGVPIGAVLATEGAAIPYAVGVDIACRMRLTVFDLSPKFLAGSSDKLAKVLQNFTRFGAGVEWKPPQDDAVLDDPDWDSSPLLRGLHGKAVKQLGTSGSGNHFVEWGELDVVENGAIGGLETGVYVALLSHSGSRGVGAQIADYFCKLAKSMHPDLAKRGGDLSNLGWLPLDHDSGREYWAAMNLAGRFAEANHRVIHRLLGREAGVKPLASVENHHNFAWREPLPDGRDVIVHRKGATPAGAGVLGVIPGSMADPGYVVRGKGNPASLNSASHGAGRQLSRTRALASITKSQRDAYLRERGVKLLGGGLDEAPQAYKQINEVIGAQSDLVDILARFTPKIVMMSGEHQDI